MLIYHAFLMLGGYLHSLKYREFKRTLKVSKKAYPKVSILIPAHNEEIVIEDTIQSMLKINYPKEKL